MGPTIVAGFEARVVDTPLKRPFVTALGRRTHTSNVALTLRLSGGARGYGEASTSLAQKHLTAPALLKAVSKLARAARGRDARDWKALGAEAWRAEPLMSPAVAAFESALVSALAEESGRPLAEWFGGALRELETDLTLSAWDDPELTRAAAAEAAADGFRTLKVKVGGAFAADLDRVRAARRGAPKAALILDGNQGLDARGALKLVEAVRKEGARVLLLEQPCPKDDLKEMAAVAKRCPVPVAADESVATPEQAADVLARGAATAVNVKLAKSGVARALEIGAVARAAGASLMIGCMAETAAGLSSSVHMALGTGWFRWADLDSDVLLSEPPAARRRLDWARRGPLVSARSRP